MGNRWSLYTEVSSGSWKRERRLISHIGVVDDVVLRYDAIGKEYSVEIYERRSCHANYMRR